METALYYVAIGMLVAIGWYTGKFMFDMFMILTIDVISVALPKRLFKLTKYKRYLDSSRRQNTSMEEWES